MGPGRKEVPIAEMGDIKGRPCHFDSLCLGHKLIARPKINLNVESEAGSAGWIYTTGNKIGSI